MSDLIENTSSRLKAIINIHTALYYFGKKRIFSCAWWMDLNKITNNFSELIIIRQQEETMPGACPEISCCVKKQKKDICRLVSPLRMIYEYLLYDQRWYSKNRHVTNASLLYFNYYEKIELT